jgi:predicted Zn-dependent peptidase
MVVPNHEVPFVSVQLGLLAGAWTETKPGTASMTLNLLTKGTSSHTEAALAEELETYAISLDGSGEMDTSTVGMSCLTEQTAKGMKLLGEVMLSPTFPEGEFKKLRKQVLTSLIMESAKPEYQAEKEFRRRMYGTHPYSRTATGEVQDVQSLTVKDMKEWWGTYARPDLAVMIISGDIEPKEAMKLAEASLGSWKANGPKPQKTLPAIVAPEKTHIYLVDQPGNTQSQILVGQPGLIRQNPEYFASRLVSSYFGWGFDSRLNKSIRVAKGLTYGVWGSYAAQRFAGDFKVGTFSKTETTVQAVKAVLDEITRLKNVGPTESELECSRSYILGSFVGQRETPQQIARDLWLVESQGLSDDYLERMLSAIAKTTKADCEKVVRGTLTPDKEIVVVVGQADQLKADLEKIAPVTVVSSESEKKI